VQGTTLVWPQVASRPPYVFEVYGTCNNPKLVQPAMGYHHDKGPPCRAMGHGFEPGRLLTFRPSREGESGTQLAGGGTPDVMAAGGPTRLLPVAM